MAAAIDFYLDFSSPYAYLASTKIDDLAAKHGREVTWRPFLLGAVFKVTKMAPLLNYPLKTEYVQRDWQRFARLFGVPCRLPSPFPFLSVNASRAFYWLEGRDPALAKKFGKAIYHQVFGEAKDVTSAEAVADVATRLGIAKSDMLAALNDPQVKDKLRQAVDTAIGRGVFGAHYIIVDGEPFWGADRLDQVERWMAGGW